GLGPFKYYYRQNDTALTDSIYTELLTIKVESVAVDTTQVIKNIKGPMEMPFHWGEILHYIVAISVCLLLLALFLWWLKTRKKPAEIMQTASRPAHESSMEELEALQQKELWQKGRYKEYQIEVSDIIRTYIEKRFSVPAMELTSDETLHHFSGKRLSVEAIEKLEYILLLADTVKFAKAVPLGTEHELSMKYAKDFVNMTKQIVDTSSAKDEKEREEMP
ncbi:MAG: hypothetical protein IT223_00285, partial [Crocinitomicaceae bacterium]|nr:hypothetical protein [Crocinitomicaceae bacterium]